ncbi:MAG: hypothetical protein VCB42_02245, partial [Myxococcota bacterium]
VRRLWADQRAGVESPWIYSREQESYNCLGKFPLVNGSGGVQLCGGLEIQKAGPSDNSKFRVGTFLGRVLTPEQEALLGCGPYFGTSCDANGSDLLWAEASALVQSFVGSDSIGISFEDLGIAQWVPASYGTHLMDNGSEALEYRIDSRVRDKDGYLIRIDKPDPDDPSTWQPADGSKGYIANGVPGNRSSLPLPAAVEDYFAALPCDINLERLVMADGTLNPNRDRTSSRCWDLRDYYHAWGIQPGTAAFEVLGLGGPHCTTADIGGPEDPQAGVLPGCRNKWATLLYRPLATWDGTSRLHPNNPDAGYVGNHWFGQVLSYRAAHFNPEADPNPRTDYRQWSKPGGSFSELDSLAYEVDCGTGTPGVPGDPSDPQNYDCYLHDPSAGSATADGKASVTLPSDWSPTMPGWEIGSPAYLAARNTVKSGLNWGIFDQELSGCNANGTFSLEQMRNDPDCYIGGWRQTVDGDPDRLGLAKPGVVGGVISYTLRYPRYVQAIGLGEYDTEVFGYSVNWGERVEGGCTTGVNWAYVQRTAAGRLLGPPECAEVFRGDPFASVADRGGSGHVFTGESFANEMAGASANLQYFLITFSEEFLDGLASVRGFVNPELYES